MGGLRVPLEMAVWGVLALVSTLAVSTYGGCQFKNEWIGKWFISGVQNLLTINATWIETKGWCVEHFNDKYIVEEKSERENCFRCMVIHEKHTNVIQYKETFCDRRDSLDNLCNQIPGDATLYSMFRVDPQGGAVPCPFKGPPFTFTYSRGNGECGNPVSRIDSCTDESRLSLRYQACPDVSGTESTVEELLCLATWKDGPIRYLVGKLTHDRVNTDEDSYRCFVYEKTQGQDRRVTYNVAQSGDATCTGLTSPLEGSKTMRLTKVESTHVRCRYPTWITDHHKWHTLDHRKAYHFSHKNATLKITEDVNTANPRSQLGGPPSADLRKLDAEMRFVCHSEVKTDPNYSVVSAYVTSGCESGYLCIAFYGRDVNVIELQQSHSLVQVPEEACSPANFNPAKLPYTTLITSSPKQRKCPHLGRYLVTGQTSEPHGGRVKREGAAAGGGGGGGAAASSPANQDVVTDCNPDRFESLNVGCAGDSSDTMEFHSACSPQHNSAYSCHGSWEDNGTHYLIASPLSRKSTEAKLYCFVSSAWAAGGEGGAGAGGGRFAAAPAEGKAEEAKARPGQATRLMLSTVAESCYRSVTPGLNGIRAFNFTLVGQCAESKSVDSGNNITFPTLLFLMTILTLLYGTR